MTDLERLGEAVTRALYEGEGSIGIARAVVEEMQYVSEGALDAGYDVAGGPVLAGWKAMLGHILSEDPSILPEKPR